jgi:uncharacterized FlgJ-related protein
LDSLENKRLASRKKYLSFVMESLLEIQRRCHEERERLQKLMVEEFMDKKLSEKDKIFSEHRVKIYLDVSSENNIQKFMKID